ncbi:MAG TPA: OmpA family protein [Allocoleopsis sp.]
MIKYSTLALVFFVLSSLHTLRGQNLVINPSFENTNDTIVTLSPGEYPVNKAIGWSMPTRAQSSLFYALAAVTQINRSLQKWRFSPKSGNNVASITTYGKSIPNDENSDLREYVQGSLSQPLTVGQKYYVEFWVHFHCEGTNNIGVAFTKEASHTPSVERLNLTPQVNSEKVIPYSESKEWHLVRDSFIAREPFAYFAIGNFKRNTETKVQSNQYRYHKAYLDDIKVEAARDAKMPPSVFDFDVVTNAEKNESGAVNNTNKPSSGLAKGETLILDKVLFNFNSAVLKSESATQLDKLVLLMSKNANMTILIKGHTSSEGTADYNLKLSEQRAKAVKDFLITKGIAEARLSSKGFGETQPLDTNDSEEGKSKNRRVEFQIIND